MTDLETIWAQYKSHLERFLHSKINQPEDVEDILQDVLLKTHLHLKDLDQQESLQAWLFKIARHAVIDHYRHKGRADEGMTPIGWLEDAETNIKSELSHCIEPFLNQLDDTSAAWLRAIDLEGGSQKACAKKLGLPYSTFKSKLQKSRYELKKSFDRCCRYELDQQGNLMAYDRKSKGCDGC